MIFPPFERNNRRHRIPYMMDGHRVQLKEQERTLDRPRSYSRKRSSGGQRRTPPGLFASLELIFFLLLACRMQAVLRSAHISYIISLLFVSPHARVSLLILSLFQLPQRKPVQYADGKVGVGDRVLPVFHCNYRQQLIHYLHGEQDRRDL